MVRPVPVPPGVHLSFSQLRIDEGTRRGQVRVVNGTRRTLAVTSLDLRWAGYPRERQPVAYDVAPGATVDLFYDLPRADCTARPGSSMGAVVTTRRATYRRRVEPEGRRFLRRIWTSECRQRTLDRTVSLRYADRVVLRRTPSGLTLTLALDVRRRAGGPRTPVSLAQTAGSVLFELDRTARHRLPRGRDRAVLPLRVRGGGRCDPHSRGQSQQSFLFRYWFRLGRGPEVSRVLEPPRSLQARLDRFLDRACAERSPR